MAKPVELSIQESATYMLNLDNADLDEDVILVMI